MLIYMATNKITDESYIGQTIRSLKLRIKDHINKALNKQNNMYIGRAIRKYGADNFEWTILHDDITAIEELNRLEIFYIGYYDTFLGEGYNCTAGGYGALPSEDTRKQLSISAKNKPPVSDEFRKKMSKITKGRIVSDKTRRKMCGKNNPTACAVIINDKYFDTIKESAEHFSTHPNTISRRLKNQKPGYQYACQKEI